MKHLQASLNSLCPPRLFQVNNALDFTNVSSDAQAILMDAHCNTFNCSLVLFNNHYVSSTRNVKPQEIYC